jgi:predicted Zn-dependent protease
LREIGIKAALADASDPDRFQKAAPYISDLLASGNARYQALGHLFQGVIELETSGLGQPAKHQSVQPSQANATATTTSVLAHLEAAAEGLKDVPTAQALYGVALVLSREPALGRQYLQDAQRLGGDKLDPRYQIWAAWSLIHAGYPEEAQPIAANLRSELESGRIASDLRPSLHILNAELLEARRTPEALRQARDEYRKAIESGQPRSPQLELRLAQLDAKLGDPEAAMRAIESLSIDPQTGPAAEQLAVITLHQHGKVQKAKERLAAARKSFPDSPGLAGLDASLSVAADKPSDADATLAAYLAAHPGSEELTLYRARVLSGSLGKLDEARSLLCTFAAHSHTSAPLVQLALLDLARKDYSAVTRTISAVRERWSEAATADLLDAQLALARGDATAAASHLQTALTKDPNNKVALFWKARLDEVHGQAAEAQRVFEQILRDRPTKEIDEGLPLASAAQWALATMALEHQEFDTAVSRFESLLSDRQANELARPARWNLAQARAARGETQRALQEVEALLAEPATTLEERVQAADFLRRHGAEAAADRQIEKVLADNPTHAGAITYRAMLLMSHKQLSEAAQLVRTTIDAGKAPAGLYLLLAAIENLAGDSGLARARSAVDEGLAAFPDNLELLRARYQLMTLARDPKALDELEHRLKDPTDAAAQSILLTAYRERRLFEKAITLTESNIADGDTSARQAQILADLILLHIQRAAFSRQQGDSAAAEAALEQARTRLVEARRRFPARTRFVELEGEVALEAGDLPRADLLAQELSDTERGSPAGPILKARIAAAKGMTSDAVSAYEEAVERNPGQSQLRLALARAQLNAGKFDAAVRQTDLVLGAEQDSPAAMVLKAQALAFRKASPREVQANREEAVRLLETVVQKAPGTAEAYHLLSDLYALLGRKDEAIDALKSCRKAFPDDDTAISLLVHRLIQPTDQGQPADPRLVEEAELVASKYAENDDQGMRSLALAVGFHRGGRPDLALPWAEKAAAANSAAVVSLTLGDILLAIAESRPPVEAARPHFERAVEAYTRVLSDEPDSIEAINNKAWILHRYLGQNALALELAESYARRADPDALPAEFLDTLGAIQLAAGKVEEAESSFQDGLRKQPEHPFLNYHMGKAVLERTGDVARARPHLVKALDGKAELPESMAREIAQLLGEPTH